MKDETRTGAGINQVFMTADAPLDNGDTEHFSVRYVGCTGARTLCFRVRRGLTRAESTSPLRMPTINPIPIYWNCYVALDEDGTGVGRWWFGDDPNFSVTQRYRVGPAGELFVSAVESSDVKQKSSVRLGFRQGTAED